MEPIKIQKAFQKEITVERDKLVKAMINNIQQPPQQIIRLYREVINDVMVEINTGRISYDSMTIRAEITARFRRILPVDADIDRLITVFEEDFSMIETLYDNAFSLLDRPYNLDEAKIASRGELGKFLLQNEKKIGNRLAIEIGALSQIYDFDDLKTLISGPLGVAGNRVQTVAHTIISGYDQEMKVNLADQAGLYHYRYRGFIGTDSRFFCIQLLKLPYSYTRAQVQQMSNGHELDVLTYKGGYNCVHDWTVGDPAWENFPPEFKGIMITTMNYNNNLVTIPQS